MYSDFGSTVGVVGYATRTLIGRVHSMLSRVTWISHPLIGNSIRRIELASGEKHQIAMIKSTKRKVDGSSTVNIRRRIRGLRRHRIKLRLSIVEGIVGFRCDRNGLKTWILAANDRAAG